MRLFFKKSQINRFKASVFTAAVLSPLCIIPFLTACGNMSYLSTDDVSTSQFDDYKSGIRSYSNYGAVQLTENNNPYDEGRIMMLNRSGDQYYAETLVHKSKKTKYFMSVGLDYSERQPMLGLRIEY